MYSKRIKGINTILGILAHHDIMQLQDKGHNCESYIFGVVPFLTKNYKQNDGPWQMSIGTACSALVLTDEQCLTKVRVYDAMHRSN